MAANSERAGARDPLHVRVLRTARSRWGRLAMVDSTGRALTFGRAIIGSLLLSRSIRHVARTSRMVGLMLPASVGGAIANLAVVFAGKVPVNLNFTAGRAMIARAIEQCSITTVITSRTFLARAKLEETPQMVFLEDLVRDVPAWRKLWTALSARLLPIAWLRRLYTPEPNDFEDLATVIFSSGSTGVPKGVMLSHRNIVANVEGMSEVFHVTDEDRILGVLPFFHSFGFTGSLWLPLVRGFASVYHPSPIEAQVIGELVQQYRVTLLISTPTFAQSYLRRCTPEQFASLRHAIVGAEKLREPVARAFRERFGLELLEGYGCTEMSPVISVNAPDSPDAGRRMKAGTVGRPLPGVEARVVDPDTGAALAPGTPGLLLVNGANQMMGYLGDPELTAQVLCDGWYVTGDIASVDEEGFIELTDRLSRFSKLGGEMVPHLKIEEVMSSILHDAGCVVTAVPDEAKGERLVAFYTKASIPPAELWNRLNDSELPKLWIPKRQDLRVVEEIPVLGTGKVDLNRVRALAAS